MADPYLYIDTTGVIVPDTETILATAQQEIQTTFGSDMIVTTDTPQGMLAVAEALTRTEVVQNNAAVANQINPNIAGGTFLDAICGLSGIQRIAATQTLVSAVSLAGVAGTVIPEGTQAQTAAGDIFSTLAPITLDGSGNGTVDFASIGFGPIPCSIGDLSFIVTNILGWETVTNMVAGVLGQNVQSDQALRAYRNNTLAFQAVALPIAITSALYRIPGMQSLFFQENIAATTETINGISMVSHSVYACVNGGSDLDVATALLENKSSGAAWNGSTTINVVEPASGQTYAVKFDRPTDDPIVIRVTTPNGDIASVKQAVLDYASGNINGLAGFVVGGSVSPFEIAGAIVTEFSSITVNKVEVSLASPIVYSTDVLPFAVNHIATIIADNITVVTS